MWYCLFEKKYYLCNRFRKSVALSGQWKRRKRVIIISPKGAVVQLVRIPACHAGGRGFESRPHRKESEWAERYIGFRLFARERQACLFLFQGGGISSDLRQVLKHAQVAELVDALVSGASVERRAGSIPVLGTWMKLSPCSNKLCASGGIGRHATLRG